MLRLTCVGAILLGLGLPARADGIDGLTSDWGTISTSSSDDRLLELTFDPDVHAFVEDTGPESIVEPGRGGQNYDVEAVFLRTQGTQLSGGLLTGFDLLTGEYRSGTSGPLYLAGDFLLDFGCDGGYDAALDLSSFQGGSVDLVRLAGDNSDLSPVDVGAHTWVGPWRWNPSAGGSVLGTISAYVGDALDLDGDHDLFEFSFDLADFTSLPYQGETCVGGNWTMECGNDYGHVVAPLGSPPVPEPGALLLVGAAVGVAALVRHRRKR
jgi:hypothetical protein